MKKNQRIPALLAVVVLGLVLARAVLPILVEWGINRALATNQHVTGRVGDVDIALWRGAYRLEDLSLRDARRPDIEPFIEVKAIDFSVDTRELLRGRLLAKAYLVQPVINTDNIPRDKDVDEAKEGGQEVKEAVVPVSVSRVEISSGTVIVPSPIAKGEDLRMDRVFVVGDNLIGGHGATGREKARVRMQARLPGDGDLDIDVVYLPDSSPPQFNLDVKLERLDLAMLNPLIKPAAGIDVQQGDGFLYAEARAENGEFEGYVKPLLQHLEIRGKGEKQSGIVETIKEGVAEVVKNTLKNEEKDSVGARVPFSGRFDAPNIGVWSAIRTVFRHAFVRALEPGVEKRL